MKASDQLRNFLISFEAIRLHTYLDQHGLPTIGIGHLLTKSELSSGKILISGNYISFKNGLTEQQVFDLFSQDLTNYENAIDGLIEVPLTQNQFDALVSFTYNVGIGALLGSTLRKLLNKENYATIPDEIKRWHHVNIHHQKVDSKGLLKRREKEARIWTEGVYEV